MQIRVERDALAHAVTWAARTLPSRPSMPVLSGVMLVAEGDSLTLSSFDYEVSARVNCPVDVLEPGKVLVSGRLLADITKSLPAAPVVVKVDGNRVANSDVVAVDGRNCSSFGVYESKNSVHRHRSRRLIIFVGSCVRVCAFVALVTEIEQIHALVRLHTPVRRPARMERIHEHWPI